MTAAITNDIVRVVLFVLAWVNSILVSTGHRTLPVIDEAQVYWVITFVVSVWAMMKEAPFKHLFASKTASEAQTAPVAPTVVTSKATVAPVDAEPVAPQVAPAEQPAQPNAPTAPTEPVVDAPANAAPKTN